jgi:purine-binding chemotaxis protein CheW
MIALANSKHLATPASGLVASTTMQVVVFTLANEWYALPVTHVREVLRLQRINSVPQAPPFVEGILSLRGRVVTVIDLRGLFGLPRTERTGKTRILIVRLPKALAGLIVDSVEEVAGLPQAAIQPAPGVLTAQFDARYLSGIARHGANLVLLLDLAALFSSDQTSRLEQGTWQKSS